MGKWFEKSTWRNLVDMHIPDWNEDFLSRFDPVYKEGKLVLEIDEICDYSMLRLDY